MMAKLIGLLVAGLLVVTLGIVRPELAAAAAAGPAKPMICNDDIVLTGSTLIRVRLHNGKVMAHAELSFHVLCVPKAGEFDMRLQEFRPSDDAWLTKGAAEKKNVADTVPGERFSMRRSFECSGDLSWRIRLFVSPGIADNGTPTPPETHYFPHKAGKQLDCDAT